MTDTTLEAKSSQEQPTQGEPVRTDTPDAQEPQEGAETFSKAYVERLRNENREAREQASRADWWATEARRLAIREDTRGLLTDPEALTWRDEWATGDGIDHDAIRAAAEALVSEKPYLARVRGDVGQGQHSEQPAVVSLSELLRA